MVKKCKVCQKELTGNAQYYCCREHWVIDNEKYTGETTEEYLQRKVELLAKRSLKRLKMI